MEFGRVLIFTPKRHTRDHIASIKEIQYTLDSVQESSIASEAATLQNHLKAKKTRDKRQTIAGKVFCYSILCEYIFY